MTFISQQDDTLHYRSRSFCFILKHDRKESKRLLADLPRSSFYHLTLFYSSNYFLSPNPLRLTEIYQQFAPGDVSEPHRLPKAEMEYPILPKVMTKLEDAGSPRMLTKLLFSES